jgi:cytokinesis protein
MQDMASLVKSPDNIEASLLSPASEVSSEAISEATDGDVLPENLNDEDVADRAASMLEGLRGEAGTEEDEDGEKIPLPREDSIRIRRRRESAQDERTARRRRRQQALSATETTLGQPPIAEENDSEQPDDFENRQSSSSGEKLGDEEEKEGMKPTTPVTIVHPPSPGGRE